MKIYKPTYAVPSTFYAVPSTQESSRFWNNEETAEEKAKLKDQLEDFWKEVSGA